jgi:hypothetical protein
VAAALVEARSRRQLPRTQRRPVAAAPLLPPDPKWRLTWPSTAGSRVALAWPEQFEPRRELVWPEPTSDAVAVVWPAAR